MKLYPAHISIQNFIVNMEGSRETSFDGIFALTVAAEFLERNSFNLDNTLPCNLFSSPLCQTSESETVEKPKILFGVACKTRISKASAKESSTPTPELSCLTSFEKETQQKASNLSYLAAVACRSRSAKLEFETFKSDTGKTAKKLRSKRNFKHSLRDELRSVGWISMQSSTSNSSFSYKKDNAVETFSPGLHSSSQFWNKFSPDLFSRQMKSTPESTLRVEAESFCKQPKPKKGRGKSNGTRLELRCIAVLKFLLQQISCSETCVREHFGDSPDTSKALRTLLKDHRVKRFGAGGKLDPFVYIAIVPPRLSELIKLNAAQAAGMI